MSASIDILNMIKKIKKPDGSEVTIEGTPDEIAAYEKQLNDESKTNEQRERERRLILEELLPKGTLIA